jgi:hypothetical protein
MRLRIGVVLLIGCLMPEFEHLMERPDLSGINAPPRFPVSAVLLRAP